MTRMRSEVRFLVRPQGFPGFQAGHRDKWGQIWLSGGMDATLNQRFVNVDPCYLPSAALDDFAEYLRQGGRFSLEVWWGRYKDDYVRRSPS